LSHGRVRAWCAHRALCARRELVSHRAAARPTVACDAGHRAEPDDLEVLLPSPSRAQLCLLFPFPIHLSSVAPYRATATHPNTRHAGKAKTEPFGRHLPQRHLRSPVHCRASFLVQCALPGSAPRSSRRRSPARHHAAPHHALRSNLVPRTTCSLPWCSSICVSTCTLVITSALAPQPRRRAPMLRVRCAEPHLDAMH
jgi:hypothetical protein